MKISVVIISFNEAKHIAACIHSVQRISDDILVIDAGSTDGTQAIATSLNARCLSKPWTSYAAARNFGATHALNNWILNLDCDERFVSPATGRIDLDGEGATIYGFRRVNKYGYQSFRFGCLGREKVWRLYNRLYTSWNNVPVHEMLVQGKRELLEEAQVMHEAISDWNSYKAKRMHYAMLCARKYFQAGKRVFVLLPFLAAVFYFLKDYIFLIGFLDGMAGWKVAIINSKYTFRKYAILYQLQHEQKNSLMPMPHLSES